MNGALVNPIASPLPRFVDARENQLANNRALVKIAVCGGSCSFCLKTKGSPPRFQAWPCNPLAVELNRSSGL